MIGTSRTDQTQKTTKNPESRRQKINKTEAGTNPLWYHIKIVKNNSKWQHQHIFYYENKIQLVSGYLQLKPHLQESLSLKQEWKIKNKYKLWTRFLVNKTEKNSNMKRNPKDEEDKRTIDAWEKKRVLQLLIPSRLNHSIYTPGQLTWIKSDFTEPNPSR